MNESGDNQQLRVASSVTLKIASDSGYGSNKSTQRSSGSSKSHESSVSSESSTAYPPHPDAPVSIGECQPLDTPSPTQGSSTKRQGRKKKSDRKLPAGEKAEATKDSCKPGILSQHVDQSGSPVPTGSQIMSPGSKASSTHDSKALQMAALTHALSCMKKFHKPLSESGTNEETNEVGSTNAGKKWQEYLSRNEISVEDGCNNENFASVVSLEDGIIIYITPSISNLLGFPKDMLVGRSFIDFVHPKDRMAFASHITCGMSFLPGEQQQHSLQTLGGNHITTGATKTKSEPFYCRLRQYRGLKTVGFGVVDKTVSYCPFKLTMTLQKIEPPQKENCPSGTTGLMMESDSGGVGDGRGSSKKPVVFPSTNVHNSNTHLVIVADRIKSAYQYPDEIPSTPGKFVTRHSASCHFGHMDSDAINYLGYLPQDLIGKSVLDYYHPEDMGLMKDIYEGVMQEQGKPFRSKPYRFRVRNGTFAMLETDWSCFINPWSWKLEFVIGQHRVVKGPGNPNVFMQPHDETDYLKNVPDEIRDGSKNVQNEIKRLLTEVRIRKRTTKTATRHLSDPLRQQSSRRRKDLAALMESLLEGMAKTENSDKSGSQCSGMFSMLERDSVMLGEISPHHDDQSGSNQSSETPLSYNQLNYRENIDRFFQSQPKTVRSNESAENSKMQANQSVNRSSDSDSKSSPTVDDSSGSNVRLSSEMNDNESGDQREECASPLTEERLSRHNEAMEKFMIQRHRELRVKSSMTPGNHKECRHRHSEKGEISHGVKRTGNESWDGDCHSAKQPHLEGMAGRNSSTAGGGAHHRACCPGQNTINLWPPFSITMTPGINTSTYRSVGAPGGNLTTSFPGLPCFNTANRHGGETGARNLVPETISMSATTPSPPLLFLPSQHHQQHQFVPQQVQLYPAGVVYQPLGSCIYGQTSPLMMPGFLGTVLHPDQSIQSLMSKMNATSVGPTFNASQGEAIGTATLPRTSDKDKPRQLETGTGHTFPHSLAGRPNSPRGTVPKKSLQNSQRENMVGQEGSGSDDSMNCSSMNTRDSSSRDEDKDPNSTSNSDQDMPAWGNERKAETSGAMTVSTSKPKPIHKKQPPWQEKVQMSQDLMYRYRMPAGDMSDVLQKDMDALKLFGKQSTMVNDQFGMLYKELNYEGDTTVALNLEEGTSNSSGDDNAKNIEPLNKKYSCISPHKYSKMVILHEENAPFPPGPEAQSAVPKSEAEI